MLISVITVPFCALVGQLTKTITLYDLHDSNGQHWVIAIIGLVYLPSDFVINFDVETSDVVGNTSHPYVETDFRQWYMIIGIIFLTVRFLLFIRKIISISLIQLRI